MKKNIVNILITILSKINGGYENLLTLSFKKVLCQPNGENVIFSGLDLVSFSWENSILCVFKEEGLAPYNILQASLFGVFIEPDKNDHKNILYRLKESRGTIPLDVIKVQKSIRHYLSEFEIKIDQNFQDTVVNCSIPRTYDDKTWISPELIVSLCKLHEMGFAHSIEAYKDDKLVGGSFGIALNGCYQGYSQFTFVSNSSKIVMYYLQNKLKEDGFSMLDTVGTSEWLKNQFGMQVLSRDEFKDRLIDALLKPTLFTGDIFNIK